jgi:hypothetical protein
MIRDSTTALIIFTILLVTLVVFLAEAHADTVYYEKINVKGYEIHLFVVDEEEDMLCGNVGCAIFGHIDGEPFNAIYLQEKYLQTRDTFGYSPIHHELKHIYCQCDWHEGLRWV